MFCKDFRNDYGDDDYGDDCVYKNVVMFLIHKGYKTI